MKTRNYLIFIGLSILPLVGLAATVPTSSPSKGSSKTPQMQMTANPKQTLEGKTIIVDIGFYNNDKKLIKSEQIAGTIAKVEKKRILVSPQGSGKQIAIPPDFSAIKPAQPGDYTLKNGNVSTFKNPDFIATYKVFVAPSNQKTS